MKRQSLFTRFRSYFFVLCVSTIGLGAFCAGLLFFVFRYPCVDFSVLAHYEPGSPSILYDYEGKEWDRFQLDKRDFVDIKRMPDHLIKAFVAAEDWSFFSHNGLSWRGIVRSFLVNIYHGRIVQGASTITQQLVKMLFYDSKRTFKRKIKEQFLTLLVERQFTKEHILETYLNHVYFGCGIYGVEAAAQRFWGIPVDNLSLEQSALLAAIICSPGHYSPLFFPYSALNRRNSILTKMQKLGFATPDEIGVAKKSGLAIRAADSHAMAPYVKEYMRTFLEEKVGKKQLYTGGLKIKTTLSKDMQLSAEKVFTHHFTHMRQRYGADLNGALISMDGASGEIRALIGGVSFAESQFNRALYACRQQGSIFKPLLYAAALEHGLSLLDTAVDEPLQVQQGTTVWEPRNHTRRFEGEMTLGRALSYSNNIISAKIILYIGPEKVVDIARRCYLKGSLLPYPSLALGCLDSTLVEVTGMFNIFAHNGRYAEPHLILWVKDSWGKILYKKTPVKEQLLSARVVGQISKVLMSGLERKRAFASSWIDSEAISKTGTTNDSRICWFGGATPEITTVVYVACDDNRPMGKNVFPLHTAYPLWLDFHTTLKTKKKKFSFDASLKEVLADWKTGKIVPHAVQGKEIMPFLI